MNGVYINKMKITPNNPTCIEAGDVIGFGAVEDNVDDAFIFLVKTNVTITHQVPNFIFSFLRLYYLKRMFFNQVGGTSSTQVSREAAGSVTPVECSSPTMVSFQPSVLFLYRSLKNT